jgi:hypothetical protein
MLLKLKMTESHNESDFFPLLSIIMGSQRAKVYVIALKTHAISSSKVVSKEENISENVYKSLLKLASSVLPDYNSR